MPAREWLDDVLPGYQQTVLPLPADDDGLLAATLVRRRTTAGSRKAVLYLHGFVDYFFQTHVADALLGAGWDFYALDLRRYGRSLRGGNRPNYCTDLAQYDAEITAAIDIVRAEEGHDRLALIGHSTGGLVASLYAHRGARKTAIDALVLNSPFFAFVVQSLRTRLLPVAGAIGKVAPWLADPNGLSPRYGESLLADYHGEWEYDLRWKPLHGFPIYFGWARAIREAQARVARGLAVACPVLLLHSDRSVHGVGDWRDEFLSCDIVLDVADMERVGPTLGPRVTMRAVEGALHDVYLSPRPVRDEAIETTVSWLAGVT